MGRDSTTDPAERDEGRLKEFNRRWTQINADEDGGDLTTDGPFDRLRAGTDSEQKGTKETKEGQRTGNQEIEQEGTEITEVEKQPPHEAWRAWQAGGPFDRLRAGTDQHGWGTNTN
jgi:hypothetical protein